MNTLSLKLLKDFDLDETEIQFFTDNNLLNFPLKLLDDIVGDYNNIIFWLKLKLKNSSFDNAGNRIRKLDSGYLSEYYYDSFGNRIREDWGYGFCDYHYVNNQITKITETNNTKEFIYNDVGLLSEFIDNKPKDNSYKCFYDKNKNLIKKEFSNGHSISYGYKNNRIMREDIKNKDGKSFIEYQYDKVTNMC